MTETQTELEIHKSSFLEYFPEPCQQDCLVAKAAAAKAARQVVELEITFDKVSEILAHRFGRCVLGPDVFGRCGKKSQCNNELVHDIEDPLEAKDLLATI